MSSDLPKLYLARHGDTAWTDSHQHTGRTDLPLNDRGEDHARQLRRVLSPIPFVRVFTSPLRRVARTCVLAGFGEVAETDRDLLEWNVFFEVTAQGAGVQEGGEVRPASLSDFKGIKSGKIPENATHR